MAEASRRPKEASNDPACRNTQTITRVRCRSLTATDPAAGRTFGWTDAQTTALVLLQSANVSERPTYQEPGFRVVHFARAVMMSVVLVQLSTLGTEKTCDVSTQQL